MRSLVARLEMLEAAAPPDGPIVVVWLTDCSGLPLRGMRASAYVNVVNVRSAYFEIGTGETEEALRERVRRSVQSWPGHVIVSGDHHA